MACTELPVAWSAGAVADAVANVTTRMVAKRKLFRIERESMQISFQGPAFGSKAAENRLLSGILATSCPLARQNLAGYPLIFPVVERWVATIRSSDGGRSLEIPSAGDSCRSFVSVQTRSETVRRDQCAPGWKHLRHCQELIKSRVDPTNLIIHGDLNGYGICNCRALHRDQGRSLCGCMPGGLHTSEEGRTAV